VAKVVNLRLVRKAQKHDEERRLATENSVRHGQTKAAKALQEAEELKAEAALDQHRRDPK